MSKKPSVELKLPILKDMELVATQTAEIVAKHMDLSEEKTGEISMALIEACINAFEHSESKSEVYIDFLIEEDQLTIKVIDKGKGFDQSNVKIPKIESKLNSDERKRGWGIMLIKELMDSVDFESDHTGTTLTMIKKKEATNE
ncbi:MAG: anti-sigma regulatory factor [Flavobacteriales bacterium]|nr:anti-sigma regulatory factor [Flavobacteriales bacterium]MBK56538.1 anti-sigma regulatory factor [Flavobacteriaceae bacterium]|tara:strand:- start:3497 stop:3925 length:429 start_codon:yes stop_codon:yes gene_type:complete